MKEVKFILNREDFGILESILDQNLGEGEGIKPTCKDPDTGIKFFGAHLTYGETAKVLAMKSPIERIDTTLSYEVVILQHKRLMFDLEKKLPKVYRAIIEKSGVYQ